MVLDLMHVHFSHCQIINSVKIVIIFRVENISLVHADNRKNIFEKL